MTESEKRAVFARLASVQPNAEMLARCKRDLAALRALETTDSAILSTMGELDLTFEIDVLEGRWTNINSF